MKKIMLIIAYDGTNYHGWQIQPNAVTIESELNKHLSALFKEEIKVIGASRTDSGVHALGNVAVFTTETRMPAEKVSYALNQRLPEDIKIQKSLEVDISFHPRHCETIKTYTYKILNCEFPEPNSRLYSHFTYTPLDMERMRSAAGYLVGTHDFKSFCSIHTTVESTIRTIYDIQIQKNGNMININISGNGFLYNMVRIIAGTLMEAGKGNMEPENMKDILSTRDRGKAGPTAPAKGLTLAGMEFLS